MIERRAPTAGIVQESWRQAWGAARSMPVLFVSGFVTLMALDLVLAVLGVPSGAQARNNTELALTLGLSVPASVITASMMIAVHRRILLAEVADRPWWRLPSGFGRFTLWLLILDSIFLLIAILQIWGVGQQRIGLITTVVVVLGGAALFLRTRLMLLFPAIALGAPFAQWRLAWVDSRGHFWRLLWVTLLALLPLVVVPICMQLLLYLLQTAPSVSALVIRFVDTALEPAHACVVAAVASCFFRIYARSLKGITDAPETALPA